MAIVLKYGSPGPILAAGYASGVGHRMHEQQDDALKVWQQNTQREFQAAQSNLDRYQQSSMQQKYFDQQEQQARAGRNAQALRQNAALGAQATQADLQRQAQVAQTDRLLTARANESLLERQQREQLAKNAQLHADLRSGDMVLPPAVKAQINQLDSGLAEALALAPAGREEFTRKHAIRRQELTNLAIPRSEQTDAEQIAEFRKTLPEEHQRMPLVVKNGEITTLPGWKPDTSVADAQKAREADIKKFQGEELKLVDENNKPVHSNPDSATTAAVARYDALQRGLRGESPPAPPETPLDPETERLLATGAKSWASGGDIPPGQMRYSFANGTTTQMAGQPQAAPAAPSATVPAVPAAPQQSTAGVAPAAPATSGQALQIPRVATPEEARKLPKGSQFILPDGRMGTVP